MTVTRKSIIAIRDKVGSIFKKIAGQINIPGSKLKTV